MILSQHNQTEESHHSLQLDMRTKRLNDVQRPMKQWLETKQIEKMKKDKQEYSYIYTTQVTRVGIVLTHRTEMKRETNNDQIDYLNKAGLGLYTKVHLG